jgi:aspartyl-tRNA(Asn)/glutamyl-tRNA(Gln) amidotransferase subunit A
MNPSELLSWSLTELAAHLRAGQISSREATHAVLDALDGAGRDLGAVARLDPERALAAADEADHSRLRGDEVGPLHGVPLAHKDMFYRAGQLAELGAAMMRGHRPDVTATVLARLDAAGAIDVGRLNMVSRSASPGTTTTPGIHATRGTGAGSPAARPAVELQRWRQG